MKNTKFVRTMLTIALVLTIIGSVTGGTIAWFTDSVESTSNIIQTGTLKAGLSYKENFADTKWKNAASGAIFDYKLWEPGYTQVRYLNIENVGNLAFKYELNVKPSSIIGKYDESTNTFTPAVEQQFFLEDVIEVYVAPAAEYGSFAELQAAAIGEPLTIGKLAEAKKAFYEGVLTGEDDANKSTQLCIALHMQETAGNEYQNLSVADGFAIQLQATQYTYEEDAFGSDQYDVNATYSNLPSAVVLKQDVAAINEAAGLNLDIAYSFQTTETPTPENVEDALENNPYIFWHADFVVSFDKDVNAGDVVLAGQYDAWDASWMEFEMPKALKAGEEIRLLGEAAKLIYPSLDITINYAELAVGVQRFNCGAYDKADLTGTTMTVELRIYETEDESINTETGRSFTLGTFTYTFE